MMANSAHQRAMINARREEAVTAMRENGGRAFAPRRLSGQFGRSWEYAHAGGTSIHLATLRGMVARGVVRRVHVPDGVEWRLIG